MNNKMSKYNIFISFIVMFILVIIPIDYTYCANKENLTEYPFLWNFTTEKVTITQKENAEKYIKNYDEVYKGLKKRNKETYTDIEKEVVTKYENALKYIDMYNDKYDFLKITPATEVNLKAFLAFGTSAGIPTVSEYQKDTANEYINANKEKYEKEKASKPLKKSDLMKKYENAGMYIQIYDKQKELKEKKAVEDAKNAEIEKKLTDLSNQKQYSFLKNAPSEKTKVTDEQKKQAEQYIEEYGKIKVVLKAVGVDGKHVRLTGTSEHIIKFNNAWTYIENWTEQKPEADKAARDEELAATADPDDTQWVQDAFNETGSFLNEDFTVHDPLRLSNWLLPFFENIIKWINRILLVALFGLSAVALSYCGLQYIITADGPSDKVNARQNIRTTFIGMFYGFGAYAIWGIAMQVIKVIIGSFSI